MPQLARRLASFTESVIREMTRVSDQYGAINLAQGFPDFETPPELIHAAQRALEEGYNQYAITWGAQNFRQALASKASHFMGLPIDPDRHVTVTCGSTEAMLASLMAVCNPGDKVIIFSPYYENYAADCILAGAQPLFVDMQLPDFTFDPDDLRRAFALGAKALILCNPANPSGKVFTPVELEQIASLAIQHDAFVLTDEVYEHIVYAPRRHTYLASLPGMFERTISCSSLSKTFAVTGWRLGYTIAPPEISDGVRKVHDFLALGAPAPLQQAAVTALEFPLAYYERLQQDYTHRRDLFLGYLQRTGLTYTEPQGAYYVLVDISPFGFADDTEFCIWLTKEIGVAAVPGSSFFPQPVYQYMRLNFAKRDETLIQAGERLLRLPEKI